MPLPHVRVTVRRLMLGVSVLAVAMGWYTVSVRSRLKEAYWQRAEFHKKLILHQRKLLASHEAATAREHVRPNQAWLAEMRHALRYHERMRRRNLYAMEHPFEYTPPRENPNTDLAWPPTHPAPWQIEQEPWESGAGGPPKP